MRRVILTLTSTVVGLVLLLSFKTHTGVALASRPPAIAASTNDSGASTTGSTKGSSTGSASSGSATTGTKTVTGDAADTRYGPVQVQVTAKNGVITAVQAVEYPQNNGRDEQINAYAIPQLNQEAETADSADIDLVSGATYTSDGYVQSLQSALDQLK